MVTPYAVSRPIANTHDPLYPVLTIVVDMQMTNEINAGGDVGESDGYEFADCDPQRFQ